MKKVFLLSITLISSLIIIGGCGTVKTKSVQVKTDQSKAISLFNGKDLTGWYTFVKGRGTGIDPKQVFTVGEGLIKISGEEYGCITTNDEFSDYKLIVENLRFVIKSCVCYVVKNLDLV
jgi:hypothetical protein